MELAGQREGFAGVGEASAGRGVFSCCCLAIAKFFLLLKSFFFRNEKNLYLCFCMRQGENDNNKLNVSVAVPECNACGTIFLGLATFGGRFFCS